LCGRGGNDPRRKKLKGHNLSVSLRDRSGADPWLKKAITREEEIATENDLDGGIPHHHKSDSQKKKKQSRRLHKGRNGGKLEVLLLIPN